MLQVRRGVFETNSSSVHSMCICSQSEYDDWLAGKKVLTYDNTFMDSESEEYNKLVKIAAMYYLADYSYSHRTYSFKGATVQYKDFDDFCESTYNSLMSDEEIKELDSKDIAWRSWCDLPLTFSQYMACIEHETFKETAETEHGDKIVVFGYYGHD